MSMNNWPLLTKQADELIADELTADELAHVAGGKPSAAPPPTYLTVKLETATISTYSLWTTRGKAMNTETPKEQLKLSADLSKNSNTEITEEELRRVSGGLNCCAGAHYKTVTIEMRKAGT
jgi:hypothetical protein